MVNSDPTDLRRTDGCKPACLEDLWVPWDSLEVAYLEWLWSYRDQDEFLWMWQWIYETCHLKLPRKTLSVLFLAGEPTWDRTMFSSPGDDCSCHYFWLQCHQHNTLLSFIGVHERSHSLHVGRFQAKRHNHIAKHTQWFSEWCMIFIIWEHLDLVVPWKAIHERHPFEITRVVNHDIHDGWWKFVFRTSYIKITKVNKELDLSVLFKDGHNISNPI